MNTTTVGSLVKIPIHLIPSPGAPDEFMATIQPVLSSSSSDKDDNNRMKVETAWTSLLRELQQQQHHQHSSTSTSTTPSTSTYGVKIILEGYTREGWSWKPNADSWTTMTVQNHHENQSKHKLNQFVLYLKERQKSAYGRFGERGVFAVSYVQSNNHHTSTATATTMDLMECRIAIDCTRIPHCTLTPVFVQPSQSQNRSKPLESLLGRKDIATQSTMNNNNKPTTTTSDSTKQATTVTRKTGSGFLGKLVGAQQRTNVHMVASSKRPPSNGRTQTNHDAIDSPFETTVSDTTNTSITTSNVIRKSAQEVIADFRHECHDKMLNFDLSDEDVLRIPIVLKDYVQHVSDDDDKLTITMEILKYIVYEAAEEVNEEWVAHKEPTEFMDDIIIVIYKEGAAPDDVLEDVNQAELPDEVRGQQRAIQEQRQKTIQQAELKQQARQMTLALHNEAEVYDDFEALNTKKRDRRTIEDYEREKRCKAPQKGSI
jgi:hypothetical protein